VSTGLALSLAALLLIANAFFVGAEFALISARRSVIEPKADEGGRIAGSTLLAMENVSLMMAGAQLGITLCTLGLGALAEPAIAHAVEGPLEAIGAPQALVYPMALLFALFIVGSLHVVLGEMVPKNIALARPDRSALALAPGLRLICLALYPAIGSLNWIANSLLRLMGVEPRNEIASAFTRDQVAGLVEESRREGFLDSHESSLLAGALGFEERTARSVILPLETIETVPVTATPAEIEAVAVRTGFSRFPVVRDGEMIGYLHLKDALEFKDRHRSRPIAESWIRPLPTVEGGALLRSVLETMQRSGAHLARVADPRGVTVGVVALEDVLEELIGEVRDATRRKAA
jgi:CBS domain containing-hemolysin-like protein